MIGCQVGHILTQNIAEKFNLTVEYVNVRHSETTDSNFFINASPQHFSLVAIFGLLRFEIWSNNSSPDNLMLQFYFENVPSKYFYCSRSQDTEAFSFLFWILPFDSWSWLFIGISSLLLTILLKGEWFQVFIILMRQDCTVLSTKKSLIVFIVMTIIFTYGYEGVISSWVIVPPPLVILKDLTELLDHDYKIIGISSVAELRAILKNDLEKENISIDRLQKSLVRDSWTFDDYRTFYWLARCNTTMAFDQDTQDVARVLIRKVYKVECYVAKNTYYVDSHVFHFHGPFYTQFGQATQWFLESGILRMYHNYGRFVLKLPAIVLSAVEEARIQVQEIPFLITELKILSIFIVWAVLVGLAGVVLIIESAFFSFQRHTRTTHVLHFH